MRMTFSEFFKHPEADIVTISSDDDSGSLPTFCYPGALPEAWVPGIAVRVMPSLGGSWIGYFQEGNMTPHGAQLCCAHPDGRRLVVVSRGAAYVVSMADPTDWEELSMLAVIGYCVAPAEQVLVLYDHMQLLGLCADGLIWSTPILSWDGIRSVEVINGTVIGEGWDASTSKYVPFSVDVRTGASSGGAAPPSDYE